jgi:hypothetical protein
MSLKNWRQKICLKIGGKKSVSKFGGKNKVLNIGAKVSFKIWREIIIF